MIIAALVILGLCLGSFVNALVWRIHAQEQELEKKKPSSKRLKDLSISQGRSMCPQCKHQLKAKDLIPILSWMSLGGKCRYCRKPISVQYPIVEAATAALFVAQYVWWPNELVGVEVLIFGLWLVLLTGLVALSVYDLKWLLLPNRLMYPLTAIAMVIAALRIVVADNPLSALVSVLLAVAVGGGLFYLLFQISQGRWIGGGDVKLGWLLGLVVGTPGGSIFFIFIAAVLGSLISLPLLVSKRLKRSSVIPFGPFLILGAVIVQLFGEGILHWYTQSLLAL